jgi:hypothetical protein
VLFKQMTVEQNLDAVATLKRLDLVLAHGFMLFDPSSTFESIRGNIAFLRGDLTHPDYDFLDLRINDYHRLLTRAVRPWIHN